MADTENQTAAASVHTQSQSLKKEKKVKNPRTKPSHPPTSEMVNNALKGLKERSGSSLQAIKKYVAANYKVDAEKVSPFIKKYLKTAVASGALVQTKGKGASGSFKLASATSSSGKQAGTAGAKKKISKVKKSPTKRAAGSTTSTGATAGGASEKGKSVKKASPKVKKATAEKKTSAKTKKPTTAATEKKAAAAATPVGGAAPKVTKPKAPSKAKKSNKAGPTKKPKAPIPKTAKSPAKSKKAASPKRKK